MRAINDNFIDDLKALGGLHQVSSRSSSRVALGGSHSAPEGSRGLFAQSFDFLSSDLLSSTLSSQGLGMFAQGLGSLRLDSNLRFGARPMVRIRRECS